MIRFCLPALALFLAGCTNFLALRQELQEAQIHLRRISGTVVSASCPECPTILAAIDDPAAESVDTYRVYERPGRFEMVISRKSRFLFGFNDLNNDFLFQENEPSGWVHLPEDFAAGRQVNRIELVLTLQNGTMRPDFGNLFEMRGMTLGEIDVELGAQVDLGDSRFDSDKAEQGLWQPLRFMKNGYAGIYFLEKYDPKKIPVLFVHGINGSPRDFSTLIGSINRRNFQPWVFYFPSGVDLEAMGDGMYGMLTELHHRYAFKHLHIVAHSMGGLVSRAYLKECAKSRSCHYMHSFTSISSPFGGNEAAQSGVSYAPVVIPVWRSMAPGSRFVKELFADELPRGVSHHLLFGYRNKALVGTDSGDGTIKLTSQLRWEAQSQADSLRGFDEDHLSILDADVVIDYIQSLLNDSQRQRVSGSTSSRP